MPQDLTGYSHAMAIDPDTGKPMPKSAVQLTGSIVAVDSSGNIVSQNVSEFRGKSTSVKPTTNVPLYSTFMEMDTQNIYYWDGSSWVVF